MGFPFKSTMTDLHARCLIFYLFFSVSNVQYTHLSYQKILISSTSIHPIHPQSLNSCHQGPASSTSPYSKCSISPSVNLLCSYEDHYYSPTPRSPDELLCSPPTDPTSDVIPNSNISPGRPFCPLCRPLEYP